MWDKLVYFFLNYIFGFLFQTAGISLCIFAYTKVRFDKIKYIAMTLLLTVISIILKFTEDKELTTAAFLIIGTSLCYILVTIVILKRNFLTSAIAALISYGSVMILESIFGALVWPLILGKEKFVSVFTDKTSIEFKLLGLPINFILILLGIIFYLVLKREDNGESGEKTR